MYRAADSKANASAEQAGKNLGQFPKLTITNCKLASRILTVAKL